MRRIPAFTLAALAVLSGPGESALAQVPPGIDLAKLEANALRRWPQPVIVSDLAGIPVRDGRLGRLGTTRQVVRTPDGGVQIVIDHGGVLGFGARPIALPIAAIAMLGRQVVVMDITPEQLDAWPTWTATQATPVPATETVKVGLTKN